MRKLGKILKATILTSILTISFTVPVFARENAFIATFFDDANLKWAPSVITSSDEIEKKYITASCFGTNVLEFIQKPEDYANFGIEYNIDDERVSVVKYANNKGEFSTIWKKNADKVRFPYQLYNTKKEDENYISDTYSAPLTFPPTDNDANASDVNRAYVISENLSDGLNAALRFLNDGKSFSETSDQAEYFQQLTYLLLSAGSSSGSNKIINNETGKIYGVVYGYKPNNKDSLDNLHNNNSSTGDNYVYIKCFGKVNNTSEDKEGETGWQKFMYRMHKGYYYDSIVDKKNTELISTRNDMAKKVKATNDSVAILDNSDDSNILEKYIQDHYTGEFSASPFIDTTELKKSKCYYFKDNGDDKSINTLIHAGVYAGDTEYINWFQMVIEAQMFKSMQITYSNQDDLISSTESDVAAVSFVRKQLNSLKTALGLSSLEQIVFNEGLRGSEAYIYGMYPQSWEDNIMYLFIICATIAISLVTISIVKAAIECNIASALPSVKISMMGKIQDVLIAVILIAFALPVIYVFTELSADLVGVFSNSAISGKFKSLESMASNNLISGIIIQFAYFVLSIYANWTYIVRGIVLALLTACAPLFAIGIAFGNKGKELTKAWIVEFVGNLILQPVHALIIAFLMSVNTGLTGIESIVFMACIIPVTNLIKSLISKGGGMAGTLGAQLAGSSVGVGAGAVSGALAGAGETAGGLADGLEGRGLSKIGMGPGKTFRGAALANSKGQSMEASRNMLGLTPFSEKTSNSIIDGVNAVGRMEGGSEKDNPLLFGSKNIFAGAMGSIPRTSRSALHVGARVAQHSALIARGATGAASIGLGLGTMTTMAGTGEKNVGNQIFNTGISDLTNGVRDVANVAGNMYNTGTNKLSEASYLLAGRSAMKGVGAIHDEPDSNNVTIKRLSTGALKRGSAVAYTPSNSEDLTGVSISKDKTSIRHHFRPHDKATHNNTQKLYEAMHLQESNDPDIKKNGVQMMKELGYTKLERSFSYSKDDSGKVVKHESIIGYTPNKYQLSKVKLKEGAKLKDGRQTKNSVIGISPLEIEKPVVRK